MPLRLCIDPGHGYSNAEPGRYDTGAVAGGVEEADLVLMWARTGEWVLGQPPFSISTWLTRTHDSPAPLSTRNEQAEMRGCTHLISLHCNSSTGTTASGTETFHRDASDRLLAEIVQRAALEALTLRNRGLKLEQNAAQGRLAILDFNGL
jgi:N-acetylmuramoyl-L-alanine amidase